LISKKSEFGLFCNGYVALKTYKQWLCNLFCAANTGKKHVMAGDNGSIALLLSLATAELC